MFTVSDSECSLSFSLSDKPTGQTDLGSAQWNSYVTLNESAGLVINHLGSYPVDSKENYTVSIFVRALSLGQVEAAIKIDIEFKFTEYFPPKFRNPLSPIDILV